MAVKEAIIIEEFEKLAGIVLALTSRCISMLSLATSHKHQQVVIDACRQSAGDVRGFASNHRNQID
jgi:hypothetical protein